MPGVVNSNCYAGYSDPAQAQRDEFEDADRYNYAVLFLANPVNDARSNGWFFPNDGVINVDHQTPCADSDSVDLEYSRLALETFASFEQVDGSKVFTKGFSQNSMWSAVLGVCFPDKVLRFAQGGSGLAIRGAAVTPPWEPKRVHPILPSRARPGLRRRPPVRRHERRTAVHLVAHLP